MKLETISEAWEGFRDAIFEGVNPSPIQEKETKKAFYAGFWAMLAITRKIGEPEVDEEVALQYLEDRYQEGTDFLKAFKEENNLEEWKETQ